jgi:hypothetical protein
MKPTAKPTTGAPVSLQDVLERVAAADMPETRRRDLRSSVVTYAKLMGKEPALIPLVLGEIRETLDRLVPAEAQVSAKRWANLRSDLAAALGASGLVMMLKTADLPVDPVWDKLLAGASQSVRAGLSRFARWATLRQIAPENVNDEVRARFIVELNLSTLVRELRDLERKVALSWNALVRQTTGTKLEEITVPSFKPAPTRVSWDVLPASFRQDLDSHLGWCAVPDPLDEGARARALAPRTCELRRDQVHSALTAAVAAGVPPERLASLAALTDEELFREVLRHLWKTDGGKLSAYTHGVAGTLIAIAKEWVKVLPEHLEALKKLRRKLGSLPTGLTPKNESTLRCFDDPQLKRDLIELPDRLWREVRKKPPGSRRAFLLYQDALAVDILIHAPIRMENLSALTYERHLHWPQGPGKPVLLVLGADETKNGEKLEIELPAYLADRLLTFRNSIAPRVIEAKPDSVFVTWAGTQRGEGTIRVTITNIVRRRLGLRLTPHQFRHVAAKIFLDQNPGGFEVVRQLLGHKNLRTTINFYAGINTKRAGRAHSKLLMEIKEHEVAARRRRRRKRDIEE